MNRLSATVLVVLASASCTSSPATSTATTSSAATSSTATAVEDTQVNSDAKLSQDFKARVEKYVSISKKADDDTPPLKKTKDPAEIRVAQDSLGQRIRALNANAKHGDVFSPEIAAYFKRLLRPEVTDKGTKAAIEDDNPESIPNLKVNAIYPEKETLSTVPPNVLMTLPKLPDDIEYRFVGKHLILRDVRANLIIDYIPNAIP